MSFAAVTLCVASQRVFIFVVYFVMTQSGNFWMYPRINIYMYVQTTELYLTVKPHNMFLARLYCNTTM
jgi:hypothetical protein